MPPHACKEFSPRHPPHLIQTPVSTWPLLKLAVAEEDLRFTQGACDSEGLEVSSRPMSPLTELESDSSGCEAPEIDTSERHAPSVNLGTASVEKRRRNAAAGRRRAKKRVKSTSSGHGPHSYAANPPVVKHRAEELPPLNTPIDAAQLPASGSGAWVGKRQKGTKKTLWTVPELLQDGFEVIEWDGG
jgi:hypothetical protein